MATPSTIRRRLLRLSALSLAALAAGAGAQAGETQRLMARGIVFDDRGASGARRPDDPGVPGVLVSNGRRITRSDAQGRYEIPIEPGSVIFVIKPAGWSTPIDPSSGLPRLYRIHDALGPSVEDAGAAYAWAKRGVHRFVQQEAVRLGPLGARICSVSPGIIDTPQGRQEAESHPRSPRY